MKTWFKLFQQLYLLLRQHWTLSQVQNAINGSVTVDTINEFLVTVVIVQNVHCDAPFFLLF